MVALAGFLGQELRKDRLLGEWELPAEVTVIARVPWISITGGGETSIFRGGWGALTRSKRLVVVSSALLSLLGLIAARFYLDHRF
jgi:hypothetical protein